MIECPNLGELEQILIAHNNSGFASSWFLDRVVIEDISRKHIYEFPCERWLASDEDDKKTARYLFPKQTNQHAATPKPGIYCS